VQRYKGIRFRQTANGVNSSISHGKSVKIPDKTGMTDLPCEKIAAFTPKFAEMEKTKFQNSYTSCKRQEKKWVFRKEKSNKFAKKDKR
jgi:hypothetical protein